MDYEIQQWQSAAPEPPNAYQESSIRMNAEVTKGEKIDVSLDNGELRTIALGALSPDKMYPPTLKMV